MSHRQLSIRLYQHANCLAMYGYSRIMLANEWLVWRHIVQKKIYIIGMGKNQRSLPSMVKTILTSVSAVFLKIPVSEIVTDFTADVKHVFPVFSEIDGLSDGYRGLAASLVENAPAAMLTPGDPLLDEAALPAIQSTADAAGIAVQIVSAPDELTPMLRALNLSPTAGLQILDATIACSFHVPPLEPHRPTLITGIYHPDLVEPLRRVLKTVYPADVDLRAFSAGGAAAGSLSEWDSAATAIYLPPQTAALGLTKFQETIAHLRAPNGCPWDRKQTHKSLRPYLLEETHEALAALDAEDAPALAEELGDVLLQILLHAQIGFEAGEFTMADVVRHIDTKIVRRHPHVFGDVTVSSAEEVTANWAAIKKQEKAENGNGGDDLPSALDGVPPTLPALSQALNISQKAVELGFEWQEIDGVLEKLVEEAREIVEAETHADIESEIGDFLFVVVNLARKMKVDPESALRGSNRRFTARFKWMEKLAHRRGLEMQNLTVPEWQSLWAEAKEAVKDSPSP